MLKFEIGNSTGESVSIAVPTEKSGTDWFSADVSIRVRGFIGEISAYFAWGDFLRFRQELERLNGTLRGRASLSPMEGQFELVADGDGLGHIRVSGHAYSRATYGNKLEFEFDIDQTFLASTLKGLSKLTPGD